jgi:hypothetical protein
MSRRAAVAGEASRRLWRKEALALERGSIDNAPVSFLLRGRPLDLLLSIFDFEGRPRGDPRSLSIYPRSRRSTIAYRRLRVDINAIASWLMSNAGGWLALAPGIRSAFGQSGH